MATRLELGDIAVDVTFKDIKNLHLSVHPPAGRVTVSAPLHMDLDSVRLFAISKLGWIRKQQANFREQERESQREYIDRESHYLWGRRYLLQLVEVVAPPSVELDHSRMILRVRPSSSLEKKHAIVEEWYRRQLKAAAAPLIAKWEPILGVKVERFFVQRMKTRWGSCNPRSGAIRLNTELAKKSPECLEYIVVHELAHLLERTHNARFVALMDKYLPNWQLLRSELNSAPLGHVTWEY